MTDEAPSVAELSDRITDLSPADQRVLLAALEADRNESADGGTVADRWRSYCKDHPHDPLCAGVAGTADEPASVSGYLDGLADGGGCSEVWEYLSAYRDSAGRR